MIFIDTSFLFAGIEPEDAHHEAAVRIRSALGEARLITTNHVRGETWTLARSKRGHRGALELLDLLDSTERIDVVHVEASLEQDAMRWLRRHDERAYSFVDATSFALMREMGINEALAFDGDFAAAGFV